MVDKPEYVALINPVPGLPAEKQRELCARLEPKIEFVVGKDGEHEQFAKLIRPPRVALVAYAGLLGEQRGSKQERSDSMVATKVAIHNRGSYAAEVGGRDSRRNWRPMKRDGEEMCRRFAQGAHSPFNGRKGTPPLAEQLTDSNIRDMLRIKADKAKYPNWPARRRAMAKLKIAPLPGRQWFIYQLEAVASARGILE